MGERKRKNLDTLRGSLLEAWILLSYGLHFALLWFLLESVALFVVLLLAFFSWVTPAVATAPLFIAATVTPLPTATAIVPLPLLLL